MKQHRMISWVLIAWMLLSLFVPECLAEEEKIVVEALKFNKWYSLTDNYPKITVYKIKVSTDTVIIVNWKDNVNESWSMSMCFYYDRNLKNPVENTSLYQETRKTGRTGVVLYPGTYYLYMTDQNEKAKVRFTKKNSEVHQ